MAGWIKRGAHGVIGTNKADSEETVSSLAADIDKLNPCEVPDTQELLTFLKNRQVRVITFADWKRIDAAEIAQGAKFGKPREKFVQINDMLSVL